MKTITIGDKKINLDIGDELKVKDFRKIQTHLIKMQEAGNEIEGIIKIIEALSPDENIGEIIDNMNIEEFTELSTELTKLIDVKKKMKK